MKSTLLPWLSLVAAALCQMGWTLSLKFLRWSELATLRWSTFYKPGEGLTVLGPLLGYIVFGIINTVLLTVAIRTIPLTTAFAVWTALSLVFIKSIDVLWLKAGWSWAELFFLLLIGVGIVGLKVVSPAP